MKSRDALLGYFCLIASQKTAVEVWLGLPSYLKAQLRDKPLLSSLPWLSAWSSFLLGYWLRALVLCWLSPWWWGEVTPSSLPWEPLHRAAHGAAAGFPPSEQVRASEQACRQKPPSLYNPISEGTPYHLCHVLFIRSKVLGPAPRQGKGLHRAWPQKTCWEWAQSLIHLWLFATPWTVTCQFLCPWDFQGKNTGVGCHLLLQGILLTQGSNLCLLYCR